MSQDLPAPHFVETDVAAIVAAMIAQYEGATGKTLYPAQIERLQIDAVAYREALVRQAIEDAAHLNLVRFSRAPMLDYLGELLGVTRLAAVAATSLVKFSFAAPLPASLLIAKGTQVAGGGIIFEVAQDVVAGSATLFVDAPVVCVSAGAAGNGVAIGQINELVTALPEVDAVSNTEVSSGGADEEDDASLRQRILIAPEKFTTAGSVGAYEFHALSANPDVVAVAVTSPTPGVVNIYPLMTTGLPSAAVRQQVLDVCSAKKVRPLTDQVQVLEPEAFDFAIEAQLTLYPLVDAATTLALATQAAGGYKRYIESQLGVDVAHDELVRLLKVAGVYDVGLVTQTVTVPDNGWARCTSIAITVAPDRRG